ncbi:preprotein translocase subunit YajC [Streptomyces sp. LBUM 1478]|uniref:Putative secreted protein n=1 Tax=Streptomyces scabiei (strain 87.22) TaxID=680198 RepID=C9Z644_STRSW|nr:MULTISPECIES: preprotein translocase subunit YajC [Streptomyces]MBP5864845.1 preprotein translocase subunit YajC [Streptomyces sp. LBUM 1484]MBP5866235.1 preprotein translocase subunit YajC [Streptomyces sp. LBUM 1485]MBP5904963.1 preprotein translocase subunit YajC [Streptomyces sp. LBUM 1478]MBP5932795.1 preprotein translocase subunit YajC [Streptomyces sp. LBUM 1479]MBP5874477.1 preprotein translocase subunit YajC [Streptomyces sp. LBUM 1477]
MSLVTLLPFIVLIGAMILMTRSAKKKQQQAADMRNQMQPGSGVRTIGGMYATVKEVSEDTVLLDAGPGVELLFAKNSIGAVLTDEEYNRIVHGIEHDLKSDVVPDDASSLTETDEPSDDASAASDDKPIDLGKKDASDDAADDTAEAKADEVKADEVEADDAKSVEAEPKKTDGESDAK